MAQGFAPRANIAKSDAMNGSRTESAVARIEAALARIDAASKAVRSSEAGTPPNVLGLVNSHEKLREEVAGTLRDLDKLIAEIEQ